MVQPHNYDVEQALELAKEYVEANFSNASCVFIGGSIFRNEGTNRSDVDMLIMFPYVQKAYRLSTIYKDLPIEYFVHDLETLEYTFAKDIKRNKCTQATIILSASTIGPDYNLIERIKKRAAHIISHERESYTQEEIDSLRYGLSDALDDLRSPRNSQELQASALAIYNTIDEAFFAFHNSWRFNGKMLPRKALEYDSEFWAELRNAYQAVFSNNDGTLLITLLEKILSIVGGELWNGRYGERKTDERLPWKDT